ncbi:hypothetical protein [Dactylosporangium sp. CA-092794]|uniref:hypothetical protein n=1 Tax=Dactylosporangium sp. CA-092794 TaxID=3239929 RepID=UPI003D90492C
MNATGIATAKYALAAPRARRRAPDPRRGTPVSRASIMFATVLALHTIGDYFRVRMDAREGRREPEWRR